MKFYLNYCSNLEQLLDTNNILKFNPSEVLKNMHAFLLDESSRSKMFITYNIGDFLFYVDVILYYLDKFAKPPVSIR